MGLSERLVCVACGGSLRDFAFRRSAVVGVYCSRCDTAFYGQELEVICHQQGLVNYGFTEQVTQELQASTVPVLPGEYPTFRFYFGRDGDCGE